MKIQASISGYAEGSHGAVDNETQIYFHLTIVSFFIIIVHNYTIKDQRIWFARADQIFFTKCRMILKTSGPNAALRSSSRGLPAHVEHEYDKWHGFLKVRISFNTIWRMKRIRPKKFASFVPSRQSRSMALALWSILEKTIRQAAASLDDELLLLYNCGVPRF